MPKRKNKNDGFTPSDLAKVLDRDGYGLAGQIGLSNTLGAGLQGAVPKRPAGSDPLETPRGKTKGKNEPGVCAHQGRYKVVVVAYLQRLLDADNPCYKPIIDQLRYHGLIPNDDPASMVLETRQEKVKFKNQIRTEITIELL